jgi:hypothetical protein
MSFKPLVSMFKFGIFHTFNDMDLCYERLVHGAYHLSFVLLLARGRGHLTNPLIGFRTIIIHFHI